MQIGYARVSTDDQTLDFQLDALTQAGCDRIFRDTFSGATALHPGLTGALDHLRAGDTLIVWRLDRLGRSLRHLIETITDLEGRRIGFRPLTPDLGTPERPRVGLGTESRPRGWARSLRKKTGLA